VEYIDSIRVCIDFGSTFTKAAVFDLEREVLMARVQAPSTVDTDITAGLFDAFDMLSRTVSVTDNDLRRAVACSSAAGGLKMICIGLVPEYTTEAGRMAALGAGAKVIGTYSYELTGQEIEDIEKARPDIILLTGGTDGGNKKTICRNAELLSKTGESVKNIIVAGNKSARDEIRDIFSLARKNIVYANNVMPEFGKLEINQVNEKIRELFISRITEAKGIARVNELIGGVIMPTPSAVLEAAKLIAGGEKDEKGLGELMLVDVGGATTDIYSIAKGAPSRDDAVLAGLPEPYAKRTVEGDLGLFHSLDNLLAIAADISPQDKASEKISGMLSRYSIPEGEEQINYQMLLSRLAVKTAASRHAGKTELVVTHNGEFWVQRGKDLTQVKTVIGAGGPVVYSANPRYVLEGALFDKREPDVLKPVSPLFYLDQEYILFAIGLLALENPLKALRIAKKYIKRILH
jgi:uncharacterized protein (TIGR01319 family)